MYYRHFKSLLNSFNNVKSTQNRLKKDNKKFQIIDLFE